MIALAEMPEDNSKEIAEIMARLINVISRVYVKVYI
jgi:hypothetical protein